MTHAEIINALTPQEKETLIRGLTYRLHPQELTRNLMHFGLVTFPNMVISSRGLTIAQFLLIPPTNEVSIYEED